MEAGYGELADAGMLLVAAAGNEGVNIDLERREYYPAASSAPNVIGVGAITHKGEKSILSYSRNKIDIFAPGENTPSIHTNYLSDGTLEYTHNVSTGTSQAAAYVSATVALIKANNSTKDLTWQQIKRLLISSGKAEQTLESVSVSGRYIRLAEEDGGTSTRGGVLTCQNSLHQRRSFPETNRSFLTPGEQLIYEVQSYNCENPSSATSFTLEVKDSTDTVISTFNAYDNGTGADTTANDGIYTGTWTVTEDDVLFNIYFEDDPLLSGNEEDKLTITYVADNTDEHKKTFWSWISASWGTGYYGSNFYYAGNVGSRQLAWIIDIPQDGEYEIYGRWSSFSGTNFSGTTIASNTQYFVEDAVVGEKRWSVDQSQNAGQWVYIGDANLTAGKNNIVVSNTDANGAVVANGTIIADAVILKRK